jgi:phosphomannomutase
MAGDSELDMEEPIISVSGLRGVIGQSLTPELALRFVGAFADELPPGAIVITRDGRSTGRMLADSVRSGLCAVGRAVIDADVAATPTTGVLVRQFHAAGGVQISASHNPPQYNGLKLFSGEGRVLSASVGQQVVHRYRNRSPRWVRHEELGSVAMCDDSLSQHAALVLATVDVDRIRSRRFKVLLDSNHGAGSLLGRHLLEALACEVTVIGGQPNGKFAHPPEPTEENLAGICRQITATNADVGFCQDPDADRLAVIDETGRYIGEECTLALCLDHVLRRRKGAVVTNCATSRMSQDIAEKFNVPLIRTAVGEANVVDAMLRHNAVFGGEGNGGPIDPQVVYVRDSFVGMALILDAMAARGLRISQLAAELPHYEIHKTKIPLEPDKIPAALESLQHNFRDATADRTDGLRLDWPDRWLLVRASNTEPIVRAIAEAQTLAAAKSLCAAANQVLTQL